MQSVHHGFKQFLAVVLSASLVFSLAPPPSRAATKTTPDASILWHPPQPLRSRQAKTLGVNSASLAINPVVGNSLEVPGVAAQHSETKTAVPVGASDPTKLRRRKIEAKSIVKRSPFGNAKIPGARPLAFIENKGQFNERVKFQVAGNGQTLWLTDTGIVFDFARAKSTQTSGQLSEVRPGEFDPNKLRVKGSPRVEKPEVREAERHVIYQDFVGTNDDLSIETRGVQQGTHNFLTGSDPSKWQTQVRGFSEIVYHDIWKSVDLRLYGKGPDLEQEFIVKPGADLSQIRVVYQGIDGLEVEKNGSLVIRTATGSMRESAPRIYQEISGHRIPVGGRFKLLTATSYTFEVSAYKNKYALVIDPTLLYSTFLGGSAGNNVFTFNEVATGIAVDTSGNAYVTGYTTSTDFPTTPGAIQTSPGGLFISKLNPAGSALIYSTYLSTASNTTGIAVDSMGNAYVVGYNVYGEFPITPNAYSASCLASGFLTVLNQTGTGLVYSTCFGERGSTSLGFNGAIVSSLTIDAAGHVFITGYTNNPNFTTTPNAYQTSYPGARGTSAFVSVFDTTASGSSSLVYSTYFGIPSANSSAYGTAGNGIAVDPFGNIYITGFAGDSLPVTQGAFQTSLATGVMCNPFGGQQWVCPDAFVAKFDPSGVGGQSLIYSTYLGGSGADSGNAIAVDPSANAYVTGYTQSTSFPVTHGAFQITALGLTRPFVTKLNAAGSNLLYSTYLGALGESSSTGIALDSLGDAYVVGFVNSRSFPVTPDAFQSTYIKQGGGTDFGSAFLAKLNPAGSDLVYSSYLGGVQDDAATAVAVDQNGDAYVTGHTSSVNFPVTVGGFQPVMHGTGDAFITKFPLGAVSAFSISSIAPTIGGNVGTVTVRVVGGGFHSGATVKLVGAATIIGSSPFVGSEGRTIDVRFDLTSAPPGAYSLSVANPDGSSASLANAFTIQAGGGSALSVSIVGRNSLVIEQGSASTTFNVIVSNTGNTDASGVVISMYGIPSDAILNPLFEMSPVPTSPGGTPVDFAQTPFAPTVGQEQIPTLLIPLIPVGSSVILPFGLGISSLPSPPPLIPAPPGAAVRPLLGSNSSIQITAIAAAIQTFCTVSDTPGDCAGALLQDIALLATHLPLLGNLLSLKSCIKDFWCLKALSVLQGAGLMVVNRPVVLNMYQLLFQLIVDCAGVVSIPDRLTVLRAMQDVAALVLDLEKCILVFARSTGGLSIVASLDPNDKEGITGAGPSNWIRGNGALFYSVYFSNEPTATAAARSIVVTDVMDASLDISTLNVNSTIIGGRNISLFPTLAPALGQYQAGSTLDLRPAQSLIVNANVSLDPTTRTLTWQFMAIDPTTGLSPSDPSVGILPPGVEGSVAYSAKPLQTIATGTSISNQATIVFDGNAAMNTPTWVNTIDNTAPASQVGALPATEPLAGFTVNWSGTDIGSGIQDFTIYESDNGGPFMAWLQNTTSTSATFTGQLGHTYGFYGIARDLVGNVEASKTTAEAATQVALVADTTPPITTAIATPAPNGAGWNNSNVTVTLNSTDNETGGTGVKQIQWSVTGAQTGSSTVPGNITTVTISNEGTTTLTYFGTDNAGNVETANTLTIRLDKTPPSVSCGSPDGLWHATDTSVACSATDVGSGLAISSDGSFSLRTAVPPGTETATAATGTHLVCDVAGNCASAGPVGGNMVDKKPPTIGITAPTNTSYLLNQAVTASYACSDGGSGVATCTGTVPSGSRIDASTVGSKTFNVNATDKVGNATTPQSVSYSITYGLCLLYDPSLSVQGGSTIPLKLQLCDAGNSDVSNSSVVPHATNLVQAGTNSSEVIQASGNANPDNDFRFDATLGPTGGYIFNLSTKGLATGSYLLSFAAGADPISHTLTFQVR